jgi:hypothetical protein
MRDTACVFTIFFLKLAAAAAGLGWRQVLSIAGKAALLSTLA